MKKIALTFLLILQPAFAYGIGVPIKDSQNLLGCWKRVLYPKNVMEQMSKTDFYDPELQKYQWYCFFENNVFRVATSNKDRAYTTKQLREIFNTMPSPMSWKWVQDSIVRVEHKDDPSMNSDWLVTYIDKDTYVFGQNLIPRGSLFMAIPTDDLKSFIVVRVLERLKD